MWKICMCGAGNLPRRKASSVMYSTIIERNWIKNSTGYTCIALFQAKLWQCDIFNVKFWLVIWWNAAIPKFKTLGAVPSRCNVTDLFFSHSKCQSCYIFVSFTTLYTVLHLTFCVTLEFHARSWKMRLRRYLKWQRSRHFWTVAIWQHKLWDYIKFEAFFPEIPVSTSCYANLLHN